MTAIASSDFGLYKDMGNQKKSLSGLVYGFIGVGFLCLLFLITLSVAITTNIQIQKSEHKAEKISNLDSSTWVWRDYPKPFQSKQHDYIPRGFAASPITESSILKVLSHVNQYKNTRNPKNIQEIIDSIMTDTKINDGTSTRQASNERFNYIKNITAEFKKRDPVEEFRPFHPGEINLMGPAGFRFAPSFSKGHFSKYPKHEREFQFSSKTKSSKFPTTYFSMEKPFLVQMSVYPMKQINTESRYLVEMKSSGERNLKNEKYMVFLKVKPAYRADY